jgi:hypothetical protein
MKPLRGEGDQTVSDEIELPKRDTTPGPMDRASAHLSKVQKALRAAGLYPGKFAEAGVEWSERRQAFEVVIRLAVPDEDPRP